MGGGASTTTTKYQSPRVGVERRQYGELGNGFKSQEEYDSFMKWKSEYATYNEYKSKPMGLGPMYADSGEEVKPPDNPYGFKYDPDYGTYTLSNGVDAEAAMKDWDNYRNERIEIATYNAKEDRRKKAPDELQSSQTVDLSIDTSNTNTKDKKVPTITQSYDTSPSTASTQQPLGIY